MAKKLTNKDIRERLLKEFNGEYDLVGDYTGSDKPLTLKHNNCGTIYTIKRAKTFLKENGGLCPECRKKNRVHNSTKKVTEDEFIKRLYETVGDEYTYTDGSVNTQVHVNMKHNVCGTEYKVKPYMFLGKKQRRCPYCGNKNRGKYAIKNNYLKSLLKEKDYGNEYEWLEEYKNNNKLKHKIRHKACGNIYEVRPNDFQQGYRCPFCSSIYSYEEESLYNFIKENYNDKIIRNYKDKLEIDIYLPKLNIGFEYNGYYWHNDKRLDKNYHLNKYNYFKEKGIKIFFVDSVYWTDKTSSKIIKNKILHLLNIDNKNIINFNKCKIKYNLSKEKEKIFLDKFHISGYSKSNFTIYLSYNKKIVALMTFLIKKDKIKLLRFSISRNYEINNCFKKLLNESIKYFRKGYPSIHKLYSIIDINLSDGNIFYENNFILERILKPSYYYVNKNKKINKNLMTKEKLKIKFPEYYDDSLNELEIVDKIPYWHRIWNLGYYYFSLEL